MVSLSERSIKCYCAWFGDGSLTIAADSYDDATVILDGAIQYAEDLALIDQNLDREKYLRLLHPDTLYIRGKGVLVSNSLPDNLFNVDLLRDFATRMIYDGFNYSPLPYLDLEESDLD